MRFCEIFEEYYVENFPVSLWIFWLGEVEILC